MLRAAHLLPGAAALWLLLLAECRHLAVAQLAAANSASLLEPFGSTKALGKLLDTAQNTSAQAGQSPSWPEYTLPAEQGEPYLFRPESDWTSAFLSQALYALDKRYSVLCPDDEGERNGTDWRALARTWSDNLYNPSQAVLDSWLHDVGFNSVPMMAELEIDPNNATARSALLSNADALANLYSPTVGCTLSWDRGPDNFEVIIDNMMNLRLLIAAADLTGNATYRTMAESHANKTIENHIRPDGSSYHVVDYSPTTGEVQWRGTAQGYSNSSTWSRGQAWGMLGFAHMYNSTGIEVYLETASRMATYFSTASDRDQTEVPRDFDAPLPTTLDTSSAMIAGSAMLFLSSLEASRGNATGMAHWTAEVETILVNSASAGLRDNAGTFSILGNATVNNRADPPINNTGAIYGDAYFIEAGNYLLELGIWNCSAGSSPFGSPAIGASPIALSSKLVTLSNATTAIGQALGMNGTMTSSSGQGSDATTQAATSGSSLRALRGPLTAALALCGACLELCFR